MDAFHKSIQYALEKLGKSKFGFERTALSNFKLKRRSAEGVKEFFYFSRIECYTSAGSFFLSPSIKARYFTCISLTLWLLFSA